MSAKNNPPNGSGSSERRTAKASDGPLVALLGGVGALATEEGAAGPLLEPFGAANFTLPKKRAE